MTELRECPFCGQPGEMHRAYDRDCKYSYSPGCETRYCPGEWAGLFYNTLKDAEDAWNTRATDANIAAIQAEIDTWTGDNTATTRAERIRKIIAGEAE